MLKAKRLVAVGARPGSEPDGPASNQEISDQEIIAGLTRGEAWASEAFYDRVATVVERTLRRIIQSPRADSEDLQQITLERIVASVVEGRFSGACSLTTWASAIAGHVGIDALRSRIRERALFQGYPASADGDERGAFRSDGATLERRLEARSEIAHVQHLLATMRPEHARALVLHDVLGHELSEIAVLTGVSVAAAQSRLVRGRRELLQRAKVRLGRDA